MNKLTPVRFDGILSGGSTKPWNVTCIDENAGGFEEIPCVVKLFKPAHVLKSNSIGKEFICCELAREFDLDTPDVYVVDVNNVDFKNTLPEEIIAELSTKHVGNTFCSKLVNASVVNEELKSKVFSIWDCATLFAFDCMILNADRGGYHDKPNLLINDEGFILIDHELTFHFIDGDDDKAYQSVINEMMSNSWPNIYRKHIFYKRLKSYRGAKKNMFDTFKEYLDRLDVAKISNLIAHLKGLDIKVGESDRLIQYLYTLKRNSHKFCTILLSLIG